jgi:hypothetical protein
MRNRPFMRLEEKDYLRAASASATAAATTAPMAFGLVRRGNFRHGCNLPSKVGFGSERFARHGVNGLGISGHVNQGERIG